MKPFAFKNATAEQKAKAFEWLRAVAVKGGKDWFQAAVLMEELQTVPMLLFCPRCHRQHIDKPKGEWVNPPHATHTCQHCGLLWRPSNRNTVGVAKITAVEKKHVERIAAAFPAPTP